MNVKKAIRKVAAMGAATALVGATLFGAYAQTTSYDLGDYPAPFVMNGVFNPSSAVIVVGQKAETSDVLGAIEVAASLQASAVTVTPVEVGAGTDPTVTEGIKIAKSGEELNYNEDIQDIDSSFTATDLPDVLPDGTFDESEGETDNEEDYDQKLEFADGAATLLYTQDDDTDVTGTYLKLEKGDNVYTYTLEFDNDVEFDVDEANDDFEGATIEIQGVQYTITDVELDGSDGIESLKLLVGDVVRWVQQDSPVNVGDHTVTVVSVSEPDSDNTKCGIEVDGEVRWLTVGESRTIGGLEVGLLDAVAVHSTEMNQDTCELSLGSQELELIEGDEVIVNGDEVDGSDVAFDTAAGVLNGITITYAPDDELFLAPGEEWADPVLGNFKLIFQGMTQAVPTEELSVTTTASDGEFTFTNVEGDEVTLMFSENDDETEVAWGDDPDLFGLLTNTTGSLVYINGDICDGDDDEANCEGLQVLAVSSTGEAKLLELESVDTGADAEDKEITFGEVDGTGTYTENWVEDTPLTVDVGHMELVVVVDGSGDRVIFTTVEEMTGSQKIETELGMYITLGENDGHIFANLTEDEGATADGGATFNFEVSMGGDDDDEVRINAVDGVTLTEAEDDSDDVLGATDFGSLVTYDEENEDTLVVVYPEEQLYANVYIAPTSAEVVAGGAAGSLNAEKVNRIPVGMSVLDVDAESMNKHMIVVGGPCVNVIADEITGEKESCAEGFEEGKAMIAVYNRNGKTALLVAGMSAQDTLAASYVLANHDEYPQLDGKAVELAVASVSDVTFVGADEE